MRCSFVPTTPQLGRGFASYVAFPAWIQETNKVAPPHRRDSSRRRGRFAAYMPNPITRENVLMNQVEGWPAGFQSLSRRPRAANENGKSV